MLKQKNNLASLLAGGLVVLVLIALVVLCVGWILG
jgi:hypothetical protein